jgi:PAS domain S-box-containing protein/putative nucleotidyltransferase with HDIG domain
MSLRHKQKEADRKKGYSSEELYRILFEQATDGAFIADSAGNYIEVNPRGCEMLGYSREEILGFSISDLVPPEDLRKDPLHMDELRSEKMAINERHLRRKDGTLIHVEISGKMLSDGMILGLVRDSSERKQAEESLRQAEEKYRNIFEHSLDGIFQSTPAGRFITVNPALARMWGYESPEDLIRSINNIALQVYVNPEVRNEFLRVMDADDEVHGFEIQVYRKDGSVIWVQESARTVKNTNGELSYYEGTVRDISGVKQAEEFLRRSEERYRRTLNNMLEGCQIIDYDWRYIYVNDTAARQGRRKPEEMLMHSMPELYPDIEKTEMFAVLQRCMEERTPHRMENQFAFPDGDTGWFELSIEPVPEGLFILSVDITERKQAEAALQQSEISLKEAQRVGQLGSWDWDADNDITTWSDEYYHIYGFDPSQQPPGYEKHLKVYTLESATRLDAAVKKALKTGESYELDLEQARSDGPSKWITARGEVKRDSSGRITGLRGTAQDITERKQAELLQGAVYQIAQTTQMSESLEELIPQIHKVISNIMPAGNFYIALYDEENNRLKFPYSVDEMDPPISGPIPLKKGLTEYVLRTGTSLLATQSIHDELENQGEIELVGVSSPVWLGVPLKIDGKTIGVMAVQHYSDPLALGEREQRILEFVSSQVAIALYRTQAEEALRESEERFRSLYENAAIGIYRTRPDGRILMVNPAALRMLGFESVDELKQRNFGQDGHELTHSRSEFRKIVEKQGTITGLESAWTRKDGSTIHVRESARAIMGESGTIKYYDGTFEDITEQKRAEDELRASEERYRDLVDNSQELICTHDLEGKILSANPWASKVLGYKPEELLNENIANVLLPESRSEFQNYLAEIQKNGRAQGLLTVKTRTGEQLIWEYNNSLRTEGVQKPIVRGMAHDVTEKRRAENKIKQQLARLTALSDIDGLITTSFDLSLTLGRLIKHVLRQLELDAASILIADPITNTLKYAAGEGFHGTSLKRLMLRVGEGYAGKVAVGRDMIHLPNLGTATPPFNQAYMIESEKFVAYYGLPLVSKGQLKGVLEVFQRTSSGHDEEWLSYLETLAGQAAIAIDNAQLFNNLQQTNAELTLAYDATIEGWSYALDLRDRETEGHTLRVTEITSKLCHKFGFNEKELTYVRWGALLHDIGKMGVPDSILQKPDKLSDDEWVIMKMHPIFAYRMLERVNYLKSAIDIPYCHHEKWDGSGYPRGLQGEQIPLSARIFAIADVWDALTSDRPYRPAWPKSDVLNYIRNSAGTHFDPQVVKLFLESEDLWNDPNG